VVAATRLDGRRGARTAAVSTRAAGQAVVGEATTPTMRVPLTSGDPNEAR
jgi:hypothetical protein